MKKENDVPTTLSIYPEELVRAPEPLADMHVEKDVYVKMRDGVRLAVDIFRPKGEGPFPVLFSISPYMKDIQHKPPHWSHAIESGATGFYVAKGYVHLIAQGRGAGISQGQWEFFGEGERTDGYDMIEWIGTQDWCNGNVGMLGDSYWSWTQYHAAIAQPPHLKCICQFDGCSDLYRDFFYQGGIFNHQFVGNWAQNITGQAVWPGPVEGKLPPINLHYEVAIRPYDGDWYQDRSAWTKLDRIKVPSMHLCPQGGANHFRGQLWAWPRIDAPKKLMVVPPTGFWSHVRFLTNPALNRQMLKWFDYWLKGIDNGIMDEPPIAIFDSATRQWRYESEYPFKRTEWTDFYLRENGTTPATQAPYGVIDSEPPTGEEAPDVYSMPESYAELIEGEPVAAYLTKPLEKDLRVGGPLSVTLHAASSQIDTAWYVYLAEIPPEGAPRPLSRGLLRASFRAVDPDRSGPGQPFHPFDDQELIEPGTVYSYEIEMRPVFRTIRKGHRLELRVASEDIAYNNFQRHIDVQILPWPVKNEIHHSRAHPSRISLPIVPDAPEIATVTSPVADIEWPFVPGTWMPNTDDWPLVAEGADTEMQV